jgi:hypothetical protein
MLILQFQLIPDCAGKKITIVTTEADGLDPALTRNRPGSAQVSVMYTGICKHGANTTAAARRGSGYRR